jgi:4-amino-4-deoxy-L-arabinose transferase-like glycosyltransferase
VCIFEVNVRRVGGYLLRREIASLVNRPVDRFLIAFTDPSRRDHAVLAALSGYLLVWTLYGVEAKSNQDLHPDMTELIAWSRDLALGFPKHPPLAAIVVRGWFAIFPISDWAYYLLGITTATATLWIAWHLFGDYLKTPTKRAVALLLLTFIPFFNFHALKFNVNTVLMPLWAVTTFLFLRSFRTRSPAYAALAGVGAGFCMISKYWSICLLAGLAVAALSDSRRGIYFRSSAPWITILTTIAVLSPHIGWLEKHNFSPIEYAIAAHGGRSFGQSLWASVRYCIDSMAFVSVPVAFILLISRPNLRTMADMAWPAQRDRRLVAVAFWATLLLPVLPATLWGIEINGIWSMSSWTLLPVLLLSSPSINIPHVSTRWLAGSAIALPIVMLLAAPAIAYVMYKRGLPPELTQSKMLTDQVEAAWHSTTAAPLRYVGGDLAYGVVAYAKDRPQALLGLPRPTAERLKKNGIAFVCFTEKVDCIARSNAAAKSNPDSRKTEVELARSYLGSTSSSQRYLILIIPPQSTDVSPPA